ncbi:MAG: nodulation protein NfeD [Desulfobacteraceae bacterium]|nr:nodulation protein NfeD [Desulfobacteraceae bacterium]
MKLFKSMWIVIAGVLIFALCSAGDNDEMLIVTVSDPISPGIAEFLEDALQKASDQRSVAIVIQLDTPGGLVESMRKIVQAIYACQVPVIVYVTPSGARAASAGVMITMAADVAVMAPGTNIGAAHPVAAGGKGIEKTMAEKVINDMVAFSKGIAKRRGRNEQWVEKAIRHSVSVTADEALDKNIIDVVAKDLDDLIKQIQGRTIQGKGSLKLAGVRRTHLKENLRTKILKTISDPNVVYILFMIGLAGIYFELSHPGAILPGVAGAIALILAFYAMQALPINTTGVLLILLALIFFILELKVTSFGMLSVAGIACLFLGSMMLFKEAGQHFKLALSVVLPTVILVSAFFIIVAMMVIRAHNLRPRTGAEGLIGQVGVVKQTGARQGKVLVNGELWRADFQEPVSTGQKVTVETVTGLVVSVKPYKQHDV